MDVLEAIKSRRSHRAFAARAVEAEKIEAILEAACWAPSPANSQPWEFVVITSDESRQQLLSLAEAARAEGSVAIHGYSYIRPLPFASYDDEAEAQTESLKKYSLLFLREVPVIVAVIGVPSPRIQAAEGSATEDAFKYACAAAIQNMLLASHSLGLGSLWFTLFNENQMKQFLNVGDGKRLVALVCLGYPAAVPQTPDRQGVSVKTRYLDK